MRHLRYVCRSGCRGNGDAETEDEASAHEPADIVAGCLYDGTEDDEEGAEGHADATAY